MIRFASSKEVKRNDLIAIEGEKKREAPETCAPKNVSYMTGSDLHEPEGEGGWGYIGKGKTVSHRSIVMKE